MNSRVQDYIDKQEEPMQTLLKEARKLILQILPGCKEEFSWGVPVYDEGKFYVAAMKERVHIGFAITGLSQEEIDQLEGTGKTMRHIKIASLDDFDEKKLAHLIELVHDKADCPPDYR